TITSCYATGAVCGGLRVGGLCGYGGTITSCYATGAVTGTDSVGGLCGYGGTISASFWDIDASGMTTSDGGTGKTTAQMQTLSTFTSAGWDFSTVWKMLRENEDYPRLIWQEEFAGDIAGLYGVDLIDLSYLSRHWGLVDCGGADDCGRADIDSSGDVGIGDLLHIANDWLKR
ncbi:MAG TPA: GLUG motif-containing protein, partial [Anaerohalosphaeraceae bacterium]|nr:GLUG motif-containing protein [Anaerohalosphaeraceae bacterium]